MQITLLKKDEVLSLVNGEACISDYEILTIKNIDTLFRKADKRKLATFLIDNSFYFVVYSKKVTVPEQTFDGTALHPEFYEENIIKTCAIYDNKFNFLRKGTLDNMAKFINIIPDLNYTDVSDIESNPALFLQIYKETAKARMVASPQDIADICLQDAKDGKTYAQFLVKPKHPIEIICQRENISRSELSRKTGITVSLINNALSKNRCWDSMLQKLRKVYKYV